MVSCEPDSSCLLHMLHPIHPLFATILQVRCCHPGDGDYDVVTSGLKTLLFINSGDPGGRAVFTLGPIELGGTSSNVELRDVDGDGDVDGMACIRCSCSVWVGQSQRMSHAISACIWHCVSHPTPIPPSSHPHPTPNAMDLAPTAMQCS